jgi:hypothetical protein
MLADEPPTLWGFSIGWSKHGIVIDLKTQLRLALDISAGHAREVATYVHGTDNDGRGPSSAWTRQASRFATNATATARPGP